jgi:hypothetical protein
MFYGRSIHSVSHGEDLGKSATGLESVVRPRASGLSALRRAIFGISPREAEFSTRGFRATEAARRERLETVGRSFIAGYDAAIAAAKSEAAIADLPEFPDELRGFVVEGAAMGLALLDLVTPWRRRGFAAFVAGPAQPYVYLAYVGAGWALARTSWRLAGRLGRLDPLLHWLMMDGYGFHAGYFQPRRAIDRQWRPRLPGYRANAFDQGLGRALWFVMGASGKAVREAVGAFVPERRPDLWSGVGLAAAFAGGAGRTELAELVEAAGARRPDLGQGAAFAAAAHLSAGSIPEHCESACQLLCGMDGYSAAALTAVARPNPDFDPDGLHYEAWRRAIRAGIAAHRPVLEPIA